MITKAPVDNDGWKITEIVRKGDSTIEDIPVPVGTDIVDIAQTTRNWGNVFSIGGQGDIEAREREGDNIEGDASAFTDLPQYLNTRGSKGKYGFTIGRLCPHEDMLPARELSICMYTTVGRRLTRVVAEEMFSKGWKYTDTKNKKEPLTPDWVRELLEDTATEYDLKQTFITAEEYARGLHQCVVIKFQVSRRGQRSKYIARIAPIWKHDIEWDDYGVPKAFNVILAVGAGHKRFRFTYPDQAVLWIYNRDPLGNMYQGRSVLVPVYWTIRRMENMIDAYTLTILMRGLGRLILKVKRVQTHSQLADLAAKYVKMAQKHVLVLDPRMDYEVKDGMHAGYDYPATLATQYGQVSTATGFPVSSITGQNDGVLASAKTNQDTAGGRILIGQQMVEENMTNVFKLFEPALEGYDWEYDWNYQIEHDEVEKANIFARKLDTVMKGEFLKTGFVYEYLERALPEGVDSDMPFAWYLDKLAQENPYAPEDEFAEGESGGENDRGQRGGSLEKQKQPGKKKDITLPENRKREGAKEQSTTVTNIKEKATPNDGNEASRKKNQVDTIPVNGQIILNRLPAGWHVTKDGVPLLPKPLFAQICRGVYGLGVNKTQAFMKEIYDEGMDQGAVGEMERRNLLENNEEDIENAN